MGEHSLCKGRQPLQQVMIQELSLWWVQLTERMGYLSHAYFALKGLIREGLYRACTLNQTVFVGVS
jgi:hypothetical protein